MGPAVDAPAEDQAEPVPADVRVRVCRLYGEYGVLGVSYAGRLIPVIPGYSMRYRWRCRSRAWGTRSTSRCQSR